MSSALDFFVNQTLWCNRVCCCCVSWSHRLWYNSWHGLTCIDAYIFILCCEIHKFGILLYVHLLDQRYCLELRISQRAEVVCLSSPKMAILSSVYSRVGSEVADWANLIWECVNSESRGDDDYRLSIIWLLIFIHSPLCIFLDLQLLKFHHT